MKTSFDKPILALLFVLSTVVGLQAQQITTPRAASPAALVGQTVGISTVTVKYSRPSVKGREVWGKLVPYGWNLEPGGSANVAPWRAGANENTVITFSHAAKLEGHSVPAGSYGLFFAVNADNTAEVILSKDFTSWGNYFYEPSHDLFRAKIQTRGGEMAEMLTYEFSSSTKNSAELDLRFEKKLFPVKIEFAVDDIVLANAEDELKGAMGFTWQGYASAANYAVQNNTHLDQALVWSDRALAINRSFGTLNAKSQLLRKSGKTADADKIMEEALTMANENDLNVYGYTCLNNQQFDKGIEVLSLATKKYPKSPNAWDSLGEAYFLKGDKKNAKASFEKSLTLNPPAGTKANSEKYLKQL